MPCERNDLKNEKKSIIIEGTFLFLLIIGATFSYFFSYNGENCQTQINVISHTTDSLTFKINKNISITANMSNFSNDEKGSTQSESALATAILRANSKTKEANGNYILDLNIQNNEIDYSINENKPELLLRIKLPNSNDYLKEEAISAVTTDSAAIDENIILERLLILGLDSGTQQLLKNCLNYL